jgi:homoserine/homoserine lactone efflux protein
VRFDLWLAYALLDLWLCLTPGPAVMTVVGQGVRHGWRRAAFGAAGISSANLLFFGLSAAGVGAFIAASPALYLFLRWGGLAFLAWSAVRLLRSRESALGKVREVEGRPGPLFRQALAVQLSNPKAIVFFTAILAPFLDTSAAWSIPSQVGVLALTTTLTEFPVLVGYAALASHGSRLLPAGRLGQWQDRFAGACLLGVVVWLVARGS